jgi:hypothetical protein
MIVMRGEGAAPPTDSGKQLGDFSDALSDKAENE